MYCGVSEEERQNLDLEDSRISLGCVLFSPMTPETKPFVATFTVVLMK